MKSFTIPQLSALISGLSYITQNRFIYCFRTMYEHTEEEAQYYWKLSKNIMSNLHEKKNLTELEYLFQKLPAMIERVRNTPESPYRYSIDRDDNKRIVKVVYSENETTQELIVDFSDPLNVLNYADLLRRKIKIIALLNYVEDICKGEKYMQAFEGDFFSTSERDYIQQKNEMYILHKGAYRKLLYTESRGYMHNGKPVMGESEYNYHVLTMSTQFERIGNIYVDYSFLVDKPEK